MIKVTLLGDSIRQLGYGSVVPGLLGEEFEVYQPDDNCRFAKYTLRGLFDWRHAMDGSRIVHWNNGLWDISDLFGDGKYFTPEEEYVENMLRIADILLSRYDKVIFATITPVTERNVYNSNEVIEKYNGLLVPLLEKKGVVINDLYTPLSKDIDRYISQEDDIHLSEEGVKVCAKKVADIIRSVAQTLGDAEQKCVDGSDENKTGLPV